ncbi:hypothetical protein A7985_04080 [Pseudoalteromonas luteoviolacea]|uniref:Uncharacterized protein n=1 Tax=Pseudoalteromonas luteoviolacea TaxID=43657 RepID=A0A1C0TUY8_9GAMM|nr:hypothetical protein [Pseudoalteromonas luteoviolacea]OCQ23137.1 hypothetical protein A7985_04080 [Pseudoalteromonas luteoviolacea]
MRFQLFKLASCLLFSSCLSANESTLIGSGSSSYYAQYYIASPVSLNELLLTEREGGLHSVRLLCCFGEEHFIGEVVKYYEDHIPNELKRALKSSGNLHNPVLSPLKEHFKNALRSTSGYQLIKETLKRYNYEIKSIWFEKFTFRKDAIHADINFEISHIPSKEQ